MRCSDNKTWRAAVNLRFRQPKLNEEATTPTTTPLLTVSLLDAESFRYLHSEGEGEADAGQADQGEPIE